MAKTLTINEDYVGNGGKLVFNTVLNIDDSRNGQAAGSRQYFR